MTNERSGVVSYLDWAIRGKPGIVRYVVAIAISLLCLVVAQALPIVVLDLLVPDETLKTPIESFSFALTFVAILLVVRLLLGRPSWSVAVPRLPGPAGDLLAGFVIMVGVLVVKNLVMLPLVPVTANAFDRWADPAIIVPYLVLAVPAFLLQTSTEELLFRGLVAQFVRRLTPRAWIIIGGSAIVFALPHLTNLANAGGSPIALVPYLAGGLLFGFAAWRSGSLWLPIGLHFGNNLFLATVVGMESDVAGTANILFLIAPSLEMVAAMAVGLNLAAGVIVHLLYRYRPTGEAQARATG